MRPVSSGGTICRLLAHRSTVQYGLHLRRVPRHDDIGQQAQGVGHGLHLVNTSSLRRPDSTGVDGAFERIRRLAPVEYPPHLPAEAGIHEVVSQERRGQQFAQLEPCVVDRVPRAAEPNLASAVTALAWPVCTEAVRCTNWSQWAQSTLCQHPPRTQQQSLAGPSSLAVLTDAVVSNRAALGTDRSQGDATAPLLSHHPFDGGASLALTEHDRLAWKIPQRSRTWL